MIVLFYSTLFIISGVTEGNITRMSNNNYKYLFEINLWNILA